MASEALFASLRLAYQITLASLNTGIPAEDDAEEGTHAFYTKRAFP